MSTTKDTPYHAYSIDTRVTKHYIDIINATLDSPVKLVAVIAIVMGAWKYVQKHK